MKRWATFFGMILFLYLNLPHTGCKNSSLTGNEYHAKLDSVHLGVRLGMERQAFYDHCWALNKSDLNITQGHNNTSVMHIDTVNFSYPVDINFYPKFNEEGKVYILPVRYEYKAWAPWNKEVFSDQLLKEVIPLMEKSYNITFKKKEVNGKPVWYHYESPRLISIYEEDDHYVHVKFKNEKYK